jgi:hypothetical protein
MIQVKKILMLSIITLGILSSTLFVPTKVHSYEEMKSLQMGYPFPFWVQNMQRVTRIKFPQEIRMGNPWEDPWHILWSKFVASFVAVFCLLLIAQKLVVLCFYRLRQALLKRK